MRFKSIFLAFLTLFIVDSAFANLSISPLKFEFSMNTNDSKTDVVKITNNSDKSVTLYTSKEDFIAWDDTWTPTFVKPKDKTTDEFSLSAWINIENWNITLAPRETREVRFTIKTPTNAEPGWHYWAVFFSEWAKNWWQVAVVQRLWALVLINVAWEVKTDWKMESFEIWTKQDNKFQAESSFSSFPINFETKFRNDWNVHFKPTWKITLIDENWEDLKNVWKEAVVSPAWAFIWEKLVDYIPVNDAGWNVLPKSSRKFESIWQWFWYQELKEDWTKVVKFKDISDYYENKQDQKYLNFWETVKSRKVTKKIKAVLSVSYEWKDKEKKEFKETKDINVKFDEKYVWVNNYIIILVILALLWSWYYVLVIKPKNEQKLKERIMKELNNR